MARLVGGSHLSWLFVILLVRHRHRQVPAGWQRLEEVSQVDAKGARQPEVVVKIALCVVV